MHTLLFRALIVLSGILPLASCASSAESNAMQYIKQMQASEYFQTTEQIALAEGISQGDLGQMQEAISQGANVNAVGSDGMTPLFWAMVKQELDAFRFLLEQGANPNVTTTLPEASVREKINSIGLAAEMENSQYLQLLLENGGNPNVLLSQWKQTPIYDAIMRRHMDNIKLLLEYGADINHQDTSGATPLIEAVTTRHFNIALFLFENGANPKVSTNSGSSAIDFITKYGDAGIDRRTDDLAAYDKLVRELKERGLMKKYPPQTR